MEIIPESLNIFIFKTETYYMYIYIVVQIK